MDPYACCVFGLAIMTEGFLCFPSPAVGLYSSITC